MYSIMTRLRLCLCCFAVARLRLTINQHCVISNNILIINLCITYVFNHDTAGAMLSCTVWLWARLRLTISFHCSNSSKILINCKGSLFISSYDIVSTLLMYLYHHNTTATMLSYVVSIRNVSGNQSTTSFFIVFSLGEWERIFWMKTMV